MTLTRHLALTGVAAAALAPMAGREELLLFAAGSVLIDVDHYLVYVRRRRNLSVAGMFRYFRELQPIQRSIPYFGLCLFHTFDFFLLIALLAMLYPPLAYLLAGCLFHFAADLVHLRNERVVFIRPFFLIEHFIRRRAEGYPWY